MAIFNRYPYTSFQEMNLDWILQELKDLTDQWEAFEHQYEGITASAETVPYGAGASVTVTGGAGVPFNFDFQIPAGQDITVSNSIVKYGTSSDTATPPVTWYDSVPVIPQGDYLWTRTTLLFSDGSQATFYTTARSGIDGLGSVVSVNNISPDGTGNVTVPLPAPADTMPLMDGTADAGNSSLYSRADHRHGSDTGKQDALISGTNIKTINSTSLLGSGDIVLQEPLVSGTDIVTINTNSLLGSGNINLQEPLISGTNIKTVNNQSLLGSGDITISSAPSSFVGMVVSGTNLATEADVKAIYGAETAWTLLSDVMLASENIFGNRYNLGVTNGTATAGAMYVNTLTIGGTAYGTQYPDYAGGSGTGSWGNSGVGVIDKTIAGAHPEYTGLIADTVTVYTWERIS